MHRHARTLMVAVALMVAVTLAAAQEFTRKEATLVDQKMSAVSARGVTPRSAKASAVRTVLTERELNVYLQSGGRELLPAGVRNPQITIAGEQRVSGRAIVDLDAVRKSKERTWLDPAAYLTGAVEVKATGMLQTANGQGSFVLESATIANVPVPKSLLQELVSYYSRTAETPQGISLDQPFELPSKIREVQIQRGAATIIQ